MAKLIPAHAPAPVPIALPFAVAEEWIVDQLEATGKRVAANHTLACAVEELPVELRRRALLVARQREELEDAEHRPQIAALDVDDPLANAERVIAAWERHLKDEAKQAKARQLKHSAETAKKRAEAKRFREAMASWIAAHGSADLKRAHQRGYKVASVYVRERAGVEFPGFMVDTTDEAEWGERSNPTGEALDLEEQTLARVQELGTEYAVRIVWLTTPPKAFWRVEGAFVDREAVVVRGWLGRYDLVSLVPPSGSTR